MKKIKNTIRRFTDWMEGGPTYLTFWFFPLLLVLGLIAWTSNKLRDIRKGYISTK